EPSQLYISLVSPDEETYRETCKPLVGDSWEKLKETLDLLPSFDCVKVLRLTLVEGLNMRNPEGYARLIEKADPDFVEPKGYVAVGHSRPRLGLSFMPEHREIKSFAEELEKRTSYEITSEYEPSRVVLLS
ncbi:MAG: 4-demethylwyosine synthase TYW1, partial [Candidatus Aenigmatarchaeota archaeon]